MYTLGCKGTGGVCMRVYPEGGMLGEQGRAVCVCVCARALGCVCTCVYPERECWEEDQGPILGFSGGQAPAVLSQGIPTAGMQRVIHRKPCLWKEGHAQIPCTCTWAYLVAQTVKNLPAMWETWVENIPWRRKWQPTPVFLLGEFQGHYSPSGRKELDRTE